MQRKKTIQIIITILAIVVILGIIGTITFLLN